KLGERGLVEERHALARRTMLSRDRREPVRPREGVGVASVLTRRREPVGAFPPELLAKHRSLCAQPLIERRAAQWSPARVFFARPRDRVVLAVEFQRAA